MAQPISIVGPILSTLKRKICTFSVVASNNLQGLDPESVLQRLFGVSGHFVSLQPSLHKANTARAPGTAGFGAIHSLAVGSHEKEWWREQDSNPQPETLATA